MPLETALFTRFLSFLVRILKEQPYSYVGLFAGEMVLLLCGIKFGSFDYIPALIIGGITWFLVWFLVSKRFLLPSSKYTIVFSIKAEGQANVSLERVFAKLRHEFDHINISREVRIVSLPIGIITNRAEAEQYREAQNVDLIIWGNAFYETKEGKSVISFSLSYTCRVSKALMNTMLLFQNDLALVLGARDWIISVDNTLFEEQKVTRHFVETVLFIFGIHLYTDNRLRDALKTFEVLRLQATRATPNNKKPSLDGRIDQILAELYLLLGNIYIEQKEYRLAKQCFKELLRFESIHFRVYINLARIAYFLGDVVQARCYTDLADGKIKGHPCILVNRAFFALLEKKYSEALSWYKAFYVMTEVDVNIPYLLEFLNERYLEERQEHGFLFALGLINYKFFDKEKGLEDLKSFIGKSRGHQTFAEMSVFASNIVEAEKYRKKGIPANFNRRKRKKKRTS